MDVESYTLKFSPNEAKSVFEKLSTSYRIAAPKEKKGKGRFSDSNVITYDEVQSFDQIEFNKQTFFSSKSEIFPTRETLLTIDKGIQKEMIK